MRIAIALTLTLGLSGAAAAGDKLPSFEMPSGTFIAPLPEGYCLPRGAYIGILETTASTDKINKTDIQFFSCADMDNGTVTSWSTIKTPLESLSHHAGSRAAMLAQWKAIADTQEGKKLLTLTEADLKTKTNLEKIYGKGFTGTAKIDALDSDDNAVYFGGVVLLSDGKGSTEKIAGAYGMTVVRDTVFALYVLKVYEDVSDIAGLLKKVKPAVASFIAANGG